MNRTSRLVTGVAALALAVTAYIHLSVAPGAFREATYKGVLFIANGIGAILALFGILGETRWGWLLGLAVTGSTMLGYIVSRTVGLPGLPAEPQNWFESIGVASLIAEGIFIILFLVASFTARPHSGSSRVTSHSQRR